MKRKTAFIFPLLLLNILLISCSAGRSYYAFNPVYDGIVEFSVDSMRILNKINYKSLKNTYESLNKIEEAQLFKIHSSVMITKKEHLKIQKIIQGKSNDQVKFIMERNYRISGKVVDEEGIPIPKVSIIIDKSTIGLISESDGSFSLGIPEGAKTLKIIPHNRRYKSMEYHLKDTVKNGGNNVVITFKPD